MWLKNLYYNNIYIYYICIILMSFSSKLIEAELPKNILSNGEKSQSTEAFENEVRNLKLENRFLLMKLQKLEDKLLTLNEDFKNFNQSTDAQKDNEINLKQCLLIVDQLNNQNKNLQQTLSNFLLRRSAAIPEHLQPEQTNIVKTKLENMKNYDKYFNCERNCENITNIPNTCSDALGVNRTGDGIYQIYAFNSSLKPFYVNCLQDAYSDNAWIVLQRRELGNTNFVRNWSDYVKGFGDLSGDYWLGLERIHALTTTRKYELWIQMKDNAGMGRYANYNEFAIANETENFKLIELGEYNGDASDSLIFNYDAKFSTYDRDNDDEPDSNCAQTRMGGWWFHDCKQSNLNGLYNSSDYGTGINWIGWHDYRYSLKYVHIAIRPVSIDLYRKSSTVIKAEEAVN